MGEVQRHIPTEMNVGTGSCQGSTLPFSLILWTSKRTKNEGVFAAYDSDFDALDVKLRGGHAPQRLNLMDRICKT